MDSPDYITVSDSAMEIENQNDSSSSDSSLFKTQCVPSSPKRRQRNSIRKCVHSLESVQARDSSSDSSIEPRPLTLKAIFERFKKKKRKKRKKRKYKPTGRPKGRPKGRKNSRSQISKKQLKVKRPQFPFIESENGRKPIPWRKILTFEQAVARGFFNYLEKLKYEYHLKESLNQMNVGEDLEKEDLDSRRYKYLDDDGSISPIEESAEEDEVATNLGRDDECDIKLVSKNTLKTLLCLKREYQSPKTLDRRQNDLKRRYERECQGFYLENTIWIYVNSLGIFVYPEDCTILGLRSEDFNLLMCRVSDIKKPGRSIYSDPNHGPKVNCLKKLVPNDYRCRIFEVCPYSSVDQRSSTKRIVD